MYTIKYIYWKSRKIEEQQTELSTGEVCEQNDKSQHFS